MLNAKELVKHTIEKKKILPCFAQKVKGSHVISLFQLPSISDNYNDRMPNLIASRLYHWVLLLQVKLDEPQLEGRGQNSPRNQRLGRSRSGAYHS